MGADVEPLEPARYGQAAAMLARAFHNDPVYSYLFPDAGRRPAQLAWIFERWTRVVATSGAIYATSGMEGAAVWLSPAQGPDLPFWPLVREGLLWTPLKYGLGWLRRAAVITADMARRQRADLDGPHWTLELLGVDPDCQRSGAGRALLEHTLAQVDADALPAYVITHNPANIAYYERFGFELLHRPDRPLRAISLRRPPRVAP